MKKFFPYIIVLVLLAGFYFIINNSRSDQNTFRKIDKQLHADFNKLRLDYLNSIVNQKQYIAGVENLVRKENELFEKVRNDKFESITESNYWHRSRLKFPSNIKMELERLNRTKIDTTKH